MNFRLQLLKFPLYPKTKMQEVCTTMHFFYLNFFQIVIPILLGIEFLNCEKIFTIAAIDVETCEIIYILAGSRFWVQRSG